MPGPVDSDDTPLIRNPPPGYFDGCVIECGHCGEQMIDNGYFYVHVLTGKASCKPVPPN